MTDQELVDLGATAVAGLVFAALVVFFPWLVGPWFFLVVVVANAVALLGPNPDETPWILRAMWMNFTLLMPLTMPINALLSFVFLEEAEDE